MTIDNAIMKYIVDCRTRNLADTTIANYSLILVRFSGYFKNCDVELLNIDSIENYYMYLKNGDRTDNTLKNYMITLKGFIKFLMKNGYSDGKFYSQINIPKVGTNMIEILSDSEIKILMNNLSSDTSYRAREKAIVILMLDCGLRRSEVADLLISKIRFSEKYLIVDGKGRKQRIIPVGDMCINTIKVYLKYRITLKALSGNEDVLFLTSGGYRIHDNSFAMLFKRLGERCSILRLHPHLLRHTFATNFLLNKMGDVYELSLLLGHADLKTTEIYINIANYYTILRRRDYKTYLDMVL